MVADECLQFYKASLVRARKVKYSLPRKYMERIRPSKYDDTGIVQKADCC